ncbi:hypothetical protein VNI00_017697 [Paramarasmius palmivorus]|uniref:Uncharacterized protein n=1 Tax=Paramarasmius palmivorus TaxID=297713 RepID=A0AAW0B7F7_9AGAR
MNVNNAFAFEGEGYGDTISNSFGNGFGAIPNNSIWNYLPQTSPSQPEELSPHSPPYFLPQSSPLSQPAEFLSHLTSAPLEPFTPSLITAASPVAGMAIQPMSNSSCFNSAQDLQHPKVCTTSNVKKRKCRTEEDALLEYTEDILNQGENSMKRPRQSLTNTI